MYKISFIIVIFITLSSANLFTMTDKKGNIVKSKSIVHSENECLNQKETEYSLQALYDELHMAENIARMAAAARKRLEEVERVAVQVQKSGKRGKAIILQHQTRRSFLIMPNISKVENMFGVVLLPKVLTAPDMYNIFTKNIM